MSGESLFRLLTKEGRWHLFTMNVVGTVSVAVGGLLCELKGVNTWMILMGLILWGIAEGQLLRMLKQEIDRLQGKGDVAPGVG